MKTTFEESHLQVLQRTQPNLANQLMNITLEQFETPNEVVDHLLNIGYCEDSCMAQKRKDNGLPEIEDCPTIKDLTKEEIEEIHRLQLTAISTASYGYLKENDSIHPDFRTTALNDVFKLYQKYSELYTLKQSIWYKLYKWFN